ncbi:N-acetyltransferase 9 protein [Colletotrichum tofieldiae]|nr:N-acetyltransferase 9 protein [Colletotrichum tofieldiae]GKT78096.1 N-acetyltransferase 9 protein [Colletotrichum tofieldiae]
MTVTELALLQFKEPLTEELKELLDYCQTVQDTWVLRQKPGLPPTRIDRGTAILQQVENPSVILLAAQWDSPQAHGEWHASPENQNVMAKLTPHIHVEGPRSVLFFHIDAPIFAKPVTQAAAAEGEPADGDATAETGTKTETDGESAGTEAAPKDKQPEAPAAAPEEKSKAEGKKKAEDEPPSLLTAPVLSVGRFGVRSEKKEDFIKKYAEAKWVVEEAAKPYPVRGGWRIERAAEDLEEFVMYCGWSTVEQHKAIAQREGFKEWAGIQEFVTGTDIWHYQRIM